MASPKIPARLQRIVAVTAGLSGTGAMVGALCAAVAVTAISAFEAKLSFLFSLDFLHLLWMVVLVGAMTGVVGAPALAWGLLRRVPLGRAILVTAIGTVVGSALGETLYPLNPYRNVIPGVIVCGWVGFVLAGIALRLASRRA